MDQERYSDYEITSIPREFKYLLNRLNQIELNLLRKKIRDGTSSKKSPYMIFARQVIELALGNIGKYPNIDYLAATIAFETRRFESLETIASKSENIFTLIPLIRGLVAKNFSTRAAANIRIVEAKINNDNLIYQVEFYIAKAEFSIASGNLTDALFQLLSAKEFLTVEEDNIDILDVNSLLAQVLAIEGKILLNMGRYQKAYETINQGLELSKRIDNKSLTAIFELHFGDYLIDFLNEPSIGNQHHRKAAALARSLMNPILIAKTLTTIGSNLRLQKNIEDGIKFCKHAEELFNKIGDEQGKMEAAIKVANLHIALGNISTATKILLELESKQSRDPNAYLNLVNAFIKIDDLDSAEIYLEKSRKYLRGRGDLPGEFLLIYYEGIIEFHSGNFSKAEFLFSNAQEFAELSKLTKQTIQASLELVKVLVSKNIAMPSKRNFKKAKFAIIDLTSQIRKDESSLEYNRLLLLKAILLFSNKEYSEAEIIFKQLNQFYLDLKLYERINQVQDYLNRIDNFKQIGLMQEEISVEDSFAGKLPKSLFLSDSDKPLNIVDVGAHPILLLILSEGGLPLYSYYFTNTYGKLDETLVSGFLGAVVSFTEKIGEGTKDAYLRRGFLQGIRHGDFEILLERKEKYFIALVVDKESYLIRKQLKRLADEINILFLVDDEPIVVLGEKNRDYIESIIKRIF